jgi:phosphopantetheinyl transferase
MMSIHLTLVDPAPQVSGESSIRQALGAVGLTSDQAFEIRRAPNGKPWIDFEHTQVVGFSPSYTQLEGRKLALIALVHGQDIGVDVELWPDDKADKAFLDTVAAAEDTGTLVSLSKSSHDAGVALWVIKEAALKCTGDVMTDPRDLAVTARRDGLYRVSPSMRANAPHPDIDVALYSLQSKAESKAVLLVGCALPAGAHIVNGKRRPVACSGNDWILSEI